VRLIGPAPASESRLVMLDVQADGVAASAVEQFTVLTPAEYFEQYLSSSAAAVPAEAPATTGGSSAAAPGVSQ
jgi:hypothetical protein